MKLNAQKIIDNIAQKTLQDLIQQSFSINMVSYKEAKELSYAMLLSKKLVNEIISIKREKPITVYFTHDIDWIYPSHLYAIIKTIFYRKDWISFSKLFKADIYLKNIDNLIAFENEQSIKSIFMVGANSSSHCLNRFDIRYTTRHSNFIKLIQILQSQKVDIGLHSQNRFSIKKQIHDLQKFSSEKIIYHRSHFLKFNPLTLWNNLAENEIEIDFSIAEARKVGFSNGIPRDYKGIDFVNQKASNIHIVPTIISDNAFFYQKSDEVFREFKTAINTAKKNGSSIAILFHPENMIVKPELWNYYKEIIHICKNEGTVFNNNIN